MAGTYSTVEKPARGYFVPFMKQLEALLNSIGSSFTSCSTHIDFNMMKDSLHGKYFKSHEGIVNHQGSLLFSLYYDEFEIVNPIGAHRKKHKISA